jgi:antitoxin component YwqK of YwqJK toxin-antitoxin module
MNKYLPILLLALFIVSCKGKLTKEVTESYPDGKPKRVQYFKGEGETRILAKDLFYYENGNKRVEGYYNDAGKKHGKWVYWYEDGTKWSEGYFFEGENDKKRTTWHENGQLHYSGTYDKGKRVGIWKFYDESGKPTKEIDYDKGTGLD